MVGIIVEMLHVEMIATAWVNLRKAFTPLTFFLSILWYNIYVLCFLVTNRFSASYQVDTRSIGLILVWSTLILTHMLYSLGYYWFKTRWGFVFFFCFFLVTKSKYLLGSIYIIEIYIDIYAVDSIQHLLCPKYVIRIDQRLNYYLDLNLVNLD